MREILFRGKRTIDGKWVNGNLEYNTVTKMAFIRAPRHIYIDVEMINPATLGQFTGLIDVAGNRIFEGDICTVNGEDSPFVVDWAESEAMFTMVGDGITATFDNYYSHDVEVIGNIHDNPELLEAVK